MGGILQEEANEAPLSKVMSLDRLRLVLEEARENEIWHWVECSLCLSRTVFESESDMGQWMKYGYCQCGYKFEKNMLVGKFPGGKVYVYDDKMVE
jgi:hypothetical protein